MKIEMNRCFLIALIEALFALAPMSTKSEPVENVFAIQREWTRLVDIYYDLNSGGGKFNVSIQISSDKSTPSLDTLSGDVGQGVTPGKCRHIVWDAGKDWPGNVDSNMVAVVAVKQISSNEEMVWIASGINEGIDPDFGPYALTNATGFWMDRTEVTFNKYEEIYNWAVANGYQFEQGLESTNPQARNYGFESPFSWANVTKVVGRDFYALVNPNEYISRMGNIVETRISCREIEYVGPETYKVVLVGRLPASNITSTDAVIWLNARSEFEGRTPRYIGKYNGRIIRTVDDYDYGYIEIQDGNGYRLPDEREWEYAARGNVRNCSFPNGNSIDSSNTAMPEGCGAFTGYIPECLWYYGTEEDLHPCCHSSYSSPVLFYNYYSSSYRTDPDETGYFVLQFEHSGPWTLHEVEEMGFKVNEDYTWSEPKIVARTLITEGKYKGKVSVREMTLKAQSFYYNNDPELWISEFEVYNPGRYKYVGMRKCSYLQSAQKFPNYSGMPVASFAPNGFGLYDMAGNVREYVSVTNKTQISYELRGGSIGSAVIECRCGATSSNTDPGWRYDSYRNGIRAVLD